MADDAAFLAQAKERISAAVANGEGADFDELVNVALRLETIRIDVPTQLGLMLDTIRFLYDSGQSLRAIPIAQKAYALAIESSLPAGAFDAINALGICAADVGKLPDAMEAYAEALTLAQGLSDNLRLGKVWLNLGAALYYGGLFREAIACFERAYAFWLTEPGSAIYRYTVFSNIALSYLHLNEIRSGLTAIERAVEISLEPTAAIDFSTQSLLKIHHTRLLLEAKKFDHARVQANLARHFASEAKSLRADIFASVAEGLVEVFSGQADVGIAQLLKALDQSRALQLAAQDALLAVIRAFEFVGKSDRALFYLRQLLDYRNVRQEQNILQHVKLHLEQLHSALEDEATAIQKLRTREEVLEGRVAKQALSTQSQELFTARIEILERMAVAAELRDDASGRHPYRVGKMASLLARECGCDEEIIFMIDIAARLHDIGKVGIPDNIVLKNGALNATEREALKSHTEVGAGLIRRSELPNVQIAVDIARHHQDWWNGSGTSAAVGENIPLVARIVALADVYDSLTHARAYKYAWTHAEAMAAINARRGIQFDPELTDRFIEMMARLVAEHADLDAYLGSAAKDSSFLQARQTIADAIAGL